MKWFQVGLAIILVLGLFLPATHNVFAQPACSNVYVVQSGDTLREIANRCGVSIQTILDLNPFITDPSRITAGWVLNLRANMAQTVLIPNTGGPIVSNTFYIVKAGDSLAYIARRLGVSEDDLIEANARLNLDEDLSTGLILRLPRSIDQPAAAVSPSVVEPGQVVSLQAGGFRGNEQVYIAGGPLGERGQVLKYVQASPDGWVNTSVQIPVNVQLGNRWAMVVRSLQNLQHQATTNLLYVVNPTGPEDTVSYTVRINDSLSAIAARFGVSMEDILIVNPQINDPRVIRVGQQILIPGRFFRQQPPTGEAAIFLEPAAGPPGTTVEVFARGLPENTEVDLRLSVVNLAETIFTQQLQSSARGTIYTTLVVPSTVALNQMLTFTADPENDQGITPPAQFFYVNQAGIPNTGQEPNAVVQLSPASGPPGIDVLLSATGFLANVPVEVQVGQFDQAPAYTLQLHTNQAGDLQAILPIPDTTNLNAPFIVTVIPRQGGGVQRFRAVYQLQQPIVPVTGDDSESVIEPDVSLFPASGPPGTEFVVVVIGYPPNQPIDLGIGYGQQQPSYTLRYATQADGNFTARLKVPDSVNAGSSYVVTIDPLEASLETVRASFTVTQ